MDKDFRINEQITTRQVRLISAEGAQLGVIPIADALRMALEAEQDLVEVSPDKEAPVCKIMDYGKFKYRQTKKAHEAKLKQKQVQIKELKIRPQTDDGDYQTKLRNAIRFLEDGDKVKVSLRFRGREIVHADLGLRMLERLKGDLTAYATVEYQPRLEGRQMIMVVAPIVKTPVKAQAKAPKSVTPPLPNTPTPITPTTTTPKPTE